MPVSKQKLKEIAMSIETGVLSNGLSDSAAEQVNRLISKSLAIIFPKGSSVELVNVQDRVGKLNLVIDNPIAESLRGKPCMGPIHAIPLRTVKTMIRAQAGDVKVPDDTLASICGMIHVLAKIIMENAAFEIKDNVAVLEAKHIKSSMTNRQNNNSLLGASLSGVRARKSSSSRKRRSSGKKKSSSKKRCVRGKSPVKGFKRDGVSIKAYCRKKSSSRRR